MHVKWVLLGVVFTCVGWSRGMPQGKVPPPDTPTDPPVTDPPATDPPATEPPATDPPVTDPPATDPPATDSPVTDPPATDPPVTDPPATDAPTEPPITPATDNPIPEPTVQPDAGWIQQGVDKITGIIKGQADFAKGTVGMIGSGMKMGTQISTAAGDLGTQLGQAALQGGVKIGNMGIDASAGLAQKGIGVMKMWGDLLPGPFGQGVQQLANVGSKGIDKLQGLGKQILGTGGNIGTSSLQWINGVMHKVGDTATSLTNKGTGKVQSEIDAGSETITNIINSAMQG